MDRIYCDSNVYRILKQDHPYHKVELHNTFEELKDKFLFVFSEAHLDDLSESLPDYRDKDLQFMEQYVKHNFFSFDHIKEKRFKCLLATPIEAFAGKDYTAVRKFEQDPWNFDNLFPDDSDDPLLNSMNKILKSYFDLPITALAPTIDTATLEGKSKEMIDKMLPGYHPEMSIRQFMESMSGFSAGLLTDQKELTELRKYIADYVDCDSYIFEKWGMAFNEKFKETGFGKTFLEMVDNTLGENQKQNFYQRFTTAYSGLEIYNITQERKKGGGLKKFDYSSLNTDAIHAYYASFCDYLITDDKGLQAKAHIMYQLFDIPTRVLSTADFINLRSHLKGQEETLNRFTEAMKYDIKHAFMVKDKYSFKNDAQITTFKTTHIYFNYFNRFQVIRDKNGSTIVLYCERLGDGNFVMYREIELMVKKLLQTFGPDTERVGEYIFDPAIKKDSNDHVDVRYWQVGKLKISLVHSNPGWGNYLCLCFDNIDG